MSRTYDRNAEGIHINQQTESLFNPWCCFWCCFDDDNGGGDDFDDGNSIVSLVHRSDKLWLVEEASCKPEPLLQLTRSFIWINVKFQRRFHVPWASTIRSHIVYESYSCHAFSCHPPFINRLIYFSLNSFVYSVLKSHFERKIYDCSFKAWVGAYARIRVWRNAPLFAPYCRSVSTRVSCRVKENQEAKITSWNVTD